MATIRIDRSDNQVATLKARAAGQGLSLEEWLRVLAAEEVRPRKARHTLADLTKQCDPQAELSAEDLEWL